MAKFGYNNIKNTNSSYMSLGFNYNHHFWVLFKRNTGFCSWLKIAGKLLTELQDLIIVY